MIRLVIIHQRCHDFHSVGVVASFWKNLHSNIFDVGCLLKATSQDLSVPVQLGEGYNENTGYSIWDRRVGCGDTGIRCFNGNRNFVDPGTGVPVGLISERGSQGT